MNKSPAFLDLKDIPCPLNVVKCKLALEKLSDKDILFVVLDKGEPEMMVKETLQNMGYIVNLVEAKKNWIKFEISYDCT